MAEYRCVKPVLKVIKPGRTRGRMVAGSLPPSGRLGRGLTETQFRAAATGNAQSRSDYGGQQDCAGGDSPIRIVEDRTGRSASACPSAERRYPSSARDSSARKCSPSVTEHLTSTLRDAPHSRFSDGHQTRPSSRRGGQDGIWREH
jgi:hypothetical protein